MRWLALSAVVILATIGWLALRDLRRGYWSARGAHVHRFTLRSKLLHRQLDEVLVTPRGAAKDGHCSSSCTGGAHRLTRT
jgi:hypothetical protein